MWIREYRVNKRNSTVCGYPGRGYDWSKFDWEGKTVHKAILKGEKDRKAPLPWRDDGLIVPNCEYLHVPYDWAGQGTIYRVRPKESMEAGHVYRGHKIKCQKVVKKDDGLYWRLEGD